jgi:NAD(P)-dependent dehydrogenase (short-subunit alcohol dehydrogenase family)
MSELVLKNKVAIVTGAAQGIGAHYAQVLGKTGAKVVVTDVSSTDGICKILKEQGVDVLGLHTDVTNASSCDEMVKRTIDQYGRVDVLVNNAALFGKLSLKPFEQIETDEWDAVMRVNVRGVFECVKAVSPVMRKQKSGSIINIASGTVFKGSPMMLHYVTSKGAIVAMSRSLARELGDDGIRVNTMAPGLVLSDNVLDNPAWQGAIAANNIASRALKREAVPSDLAGSLIYFASDASLFVTGQVLVIDGGSVMH